MKGALRRAMEDELKVMPPTRYTIVVPEDMRFRLGGDIAEWEDELAEYFLEVVRENRWSAVSHPMVRVMYDPRLKGSDIRVSVDESYLAHHGDPVPRRARSSVLTTVLVSSVILLACAYLLALLAIPGLLPTSFETPALPAVVGSGVQSAWHSAGDRVASWWDGDGGPGNGQEGSGPQAGDGSGQSGTKVRGEVTVYPMAHVRAGSPSRSGGVHPNYHFPQGMKLEWSPSQVVEGESINGEKRWIEVGTAGPDWGDRQGQKLYVWMGGLKVQQ